MYDYRQATHTTMFRDYNRFIQDLRNSIKGEREAIAFYTRLAELAPSSYARNQVMFALRDEQRHNQMLTNLYIQLTGSRPGIRVSPQLPTNFISGLTTALNDELAAADTYKSMYLNALDRNIQNIFFDIMHDEHEHATRFAYVRGTL
ncbi:MAG TPA: ferritin-like domain-containing protein [Bacillota bacterium]|nr:ferritin-like domain-containing protein [Bacillota bacterium]